MWLPRRHIVIGGGEGGGMQTYMQKRKHGRISTETLRILNKLVRKRLVKSQSRTSHDGFLFFP